MKGLDTSVLLRLATRDDPAQAASAAAYVRRHCSGERPGRIDRIVLCEAVWSLSTAYGYDREQIAAFIDTLLRAPSLEVDSRAQVADALRRYRDGGPDFSDCLIGLVNSHSGCDATATFDRRAARLQEFELIAG